MVFWLSWLILLIVAILAFYLPIRQDYLRNGKLSWFSTTLELLILAGHANLLYLSSDLPWPELPPLPEIGAWRFTLLGLMTLGGILTLTFMAYLGFIAAFGQKTNELRQSGPYRWTRNPQLLAYYIVVIGFALLYPSLESAAWVLLYGIIAHVMIKTEEEHLLNVFGTSYLEYCDRVPRYIRFPTIKQIFSTKSKE